MIFLDFFWFSVLVSGAHWVREKKKKLLKFIIDQPPTDVYFTIFWLKQPPRLQGGSYLQAEISMIWHFFLNQPPQGCLRPKILNYGPIGISWSGSLGWAIKLIIHRILLYGHIKKAKNHYS